MDSPSVSAAPGSGGQVTASSNADAPDDDGASPATSQAASNGQEKRRSRPNEQRMAELEKKRDRLYRELGRFVRTLDGELRKSKPSTRYVWKSLEPAERCENELRKVMGEMYSLMEHEGDESSLEWLSTKEEDLDREVSLLADASAYLEERQHWAGAHTRSMSAHESRYMHMRPIDASTESPQPAFGSGLDHAEEELSSALEPGATSVSSSVAAQLSQPAPCLAVSEDNANAPVSPGSSMARSVGHAVSFQSQSATCTSDGSCSASDQSGAFMLSPLHASLPSVTAPPASSQSQQSQLHPSACSRVLSSVMDQQPQRVQSSSSAALGPPQPLQVHSTGSLRGTTALHNTPMYGQNTASLRPGPRPTWLNAMPRPSLQARPAPSGSHIPQPVVWPSASAYQQPQVPRPPPANTHRVNNLLKPLALPKFNGEASEYMKWKQQFCQIVDADMSLPDDYKLARLREALEGGKAADMIGEIFDGAGAYQAAWQELESWFGGSDRHMEQQRRTIINYPRITREQDTDGLQKYAIKLRNVLANMQTTGIVPGEELYLIATEKIPKTMLVRYMEAHEGKPDDIETFSRWLVARLKTLKRAADRVDSHTEGSSTTRERRHKTMAAVESLPDQATARASTSNEHKPTPPQCPKCRGPHSLETCSSFKAIALNKKWNLVKLLELCSCCLKPGHWARDCKGKTCSKCSGRHHSILHFEKKEKKEASDPKQKANSGGEAARGATNSSMGGDDAIDLDIAFMTTNVSLACDDGSRATATALLDSGSSCSYITEALADKLNLSGPSLNMETVVLGGGVVSGKKQRVTVNIRHESGQGQSAVEAWVLPKITTEMNVTDWNKQKLAWKHLEDIEFPEATSGTVDLLIGLNAPTLHSAIEEIRGGEDQPIARKTPLGWICFGTAQQQGPKAATLTALQATNDSSLDSTAQKFWELESVGMDAPSRDGNYLSPSEKEAEALTKKSLAFKDGRFEVGIPWVGGERPVLQSNLHVATYRLNTLIRTLERHPDIKLEYEQVLRRYLEKAYVRLVSPDEVQQCADRQWFLPHFPVVRADKTTTKVRLVFDASAQSNGKSINDHMHAGQKILNNLVHVLLRFCLEPVALTGDVSEMFLQVGLAPPDRQYVRFLWQDEQRQNQVFEFCRLPFGLKASPYLASTALREAASQASGSNTARAIKEDFYVDDLLHSCPSVKEAKELRQDMQAALSSAGFHIRKWLSNDKDVMQSVPVEDQAKSPVMTISAQDPDVIPSAKTLGVLWVANEDHFTFAYQCPEKLTFTRRGMLSAMCHVFDPRGQIAPFVIRGRLLFQEDCISGKTWDQELDETQQRRWQAWFQELPDLARIQARRPFKEHGGGEISIHTFTDASESAYAAVTYVRQQRSDETGRVTLAMAKARPSPTRRKSIPMLELQGAVLGARLSKHVGLALDVPPQQQHLWTDSMNVLHWVKAPSRKFKAEVGNRISEIQETTRIGNWSHVAGKVNPADKPTRGMTATALAEDEQWWKGPDFLSRSPQDWPRREVIPPAELPGQLKKMTGRALTLLGATSDRLQASNFSSWKRLLRVTAWCQRFINRCRNQERPSETLTKDQPSVCVSDLSLPSGSKLSVPELTSVEIEQAERYWIAAAQREAYPQVFEQLEASKELRHDSPLGKLKPMLDNSTTPALLVVGGRLRTSHHLPQGIRHPVILPPKHHVTDLIIRDEDARCSHSVGANHLLSNLAVKYWVVRGTRLVRQHRQQCVTCRRVWAKTASPAMAPLPPFRTAGPLIAFSRVGVDYAGPFFTRQGRGRSQCKRYVCVFSCLQTRACHLEIVYSLDATGFLMAFDRFSKRRGVPKEVVSDNGSNFIAAERELREAVEEIQKNSSVASSMADRKIKWRFNPPRSPHFGGVFETLVRSLKRTLQRVLYRADLSDEELHTALVQSEALINSRPVTTLAREAADPLPLTPTHFLVGHANVHLPADEAADGEDKVHPRRRWKYVLSLIKDIWRRWIREVVPKLNRQSKWHKQEQSLRVGDVVLVLDENTPRATWPLGRITATHPGEDGVTRVVDLLIKGHAYRRSVHRLVPLEAPAADDDDGEDQTSAALETDDLR